MCLNARMLISNPVHSNSEIEHLTQMSFNFLQWYANNLSLPFITCNKDEPVLYFEVSLYIRNNPLCLGIYNTGWHCSIAFNFSRDCACSNTIQICHFSSGFVYYTHIIL